MRTLCKIFVIAAFGLTVVNAGVAEAASPSQQNQKASEKALKAAKNNAWTEAHKLAQQANDPLTVKLIEWLHFQRTGAKTAFTPIAEFIEANSNWPRMSRLRRAAEAAIGNSDDPVSLNDWFERYPPLSGAGALAHLDALIATGQLAAARPLVSQYWRNLDFKSEDGKEFHRKFGKHLANADHIERLDRLIWDHKYWPARRMLRRVDAPQAALGRARLALMRREAGVVGAIAKVPAALRDAPGLQYERLRWRRRKGKNSSARELLSAAPSVAANQEAWAFERLILARRAVIDGHYSEARQMVSAHDLTGGANFAEAEFLAGWISLAFLKEPKIAYQHFTRLYDGVGYPISRARGAFWAGRAAAALGDAADAERWWREAAKYPATFYGQHALAALGETNPGISFSSSPESPATTNSFEPELQQAVRLLHQHGQKPLITPFLRKLTQLSATLEDRFAIIRLANDVDQPHEAVRTAKRAAQLDNVVPTPGYPFLPFDNSRTSTAKQQHEAPLILALIRQESAFDPRALSRAGARGMMQLMPATAKRVARATGLPYSRARLMDDPKYNIKLGMAYLETMMAKFDHTAALALAAYNAGPGRVDRWLRQIGDPRAGDVELIDWIESIPFGETRNYVQRVLESETVYRELLLNAQLASVPAPSAAGDSARKQP